MYADSTISASALDRGGYRGIGKKYVFTEVYSK
jgi:hypothetical protein